MNISINQWLLVFMIILIIVGILQLMLLFRLALLLREVIKQLQETQDESRILSRNLMSTVQEASRSLVTELRDEFSKSSQKGRQL